MTTRTGGWTEEMERVFLATLAETGRVARAAELIGRTPGAGHYRRQRRPAFARAWDEALATYERSRATHARPAVGAVAVLPADPGDRFRRWHRNGWHPRKKELFLEALRANGSISDAARAVGMSTKSVYDLSEHDPGFRRACDEALATIRPSLLETAYQRAVIGTDDPVFHAGQLVGTRRKYSDAMLRLLIDRGFDPAQPPPATVLEAPKAKWDGPGWPTQQEVDEALLKRLEELGERLAREEQRKAARSAEDIAAPSDDPLAD